MMANSSNKPETVGWQSIGEVLETFYSLSSHSRSFSSESGECSTSNQSAGRSNVENHPDSSQGLHESTSEEVKIVEKPIYRSVGRGQYVKDLEKRISREQLDKTIPHEVEQVRKDEKPIYRSVGRGQYKKDFEQRISREQLDESIPHEIEQVKIDEKPLYRGIGRGEYMKQIEARISRDLFDQKIHNELRELFKCDFSNAAIESHFASACSSSSEPSIQETREFHDPNPEYYPGEIEFVIGESDIMKKINALERGCTIEDNPRDTDFVIGESDTMKKINILEKGSTKKKSPRCRNAIILSLTQKKNSDQDIVKAPELKGPDVFLSSKSYCNVVSAPSTSSSKQDDGPNLTEKEFPPL